MPLERTNFQSRFHQRWHHLHDPHVRALAWLLDAPDLLDPTAPQWRGRIASLGPIEPNIREWLSALDEAPAELHAYLGLQPFTRLGRYAEKLMAFYFQRQGMLFAHGLQIRGDRNETIGEFDFLLRQDDALIHWEFASKFYLLESNGAAPQADRFIGPNLADTLGAKIRKIMERQLSLSQHPASQRQLPRPVAVAQALVKGWLFYQGQTPQPTGMTGISHPHCHGFWRQLAEFGAIDTDRYLVLPRLAWLAPARAVLEQCMGGQDIRDWLHAHFKKESTPVLMACMREAADGGLLEIDRGFIVPDGWRSRAEQAIAQCLTSPISDSESCSR